MNDGSKLGIAAISALAACVVLFNCNISDIRAPILKDDDLTVETYASGLNEPTTMAFLGIDDTLVLEKSTGTVIRIKDGKKLSEPVLKKEVASNKEHGMLGIDVIKRFSNSTTNVYDIFLRYTQDMSAVNDNVTNQTQSDEQKKISNRLYKYTFVDNIELGPSSGSIIDEEILLDLPISETTERHVGGVIAINPLNTDEIYTVIGDLDLPNRTKMQNIETGLEADGSAGILRITSDGRPIGNETTNLGSYHPLDKYFAYGIRNSFGFAFDPITGNLWDTENGVSTDDELNLVEHGFNSGWQKIMGMSPKGFNISKDLVMFGNKSKYSDPKFVWKQVVAPTGIAFLSSDNLGREFQDDLFVASSMKGKIYNFDLDPERTGLLLDGVLSDKIADSENETDMITFGEQFGGITDLKIGPDGLLYVVSLTDGAIYRITNKNPS